MIAGNIRSIVRESRFYDLQVSLQDGVVTGAVMTENTERAPIRTQFSLNLPGAQRLGAIAVHSARNQEKLSSQFANIQDGTTENVEAIGGLEAIAASIVMPSAQGIDKVAPVLNSAIDDIGKMTYITVFGREKHLLNNKHIESLKAALDQILVQERKIGANLQGSIGVGTTWQPSLIQQN